MRAHSLRFQATTQEEEGNPPVQWFQDPDQTVVATQKAHKIPCTPLYGNRHGPVALQRFCWRDLNPATHATCRPTSRWRPVHAELPANCLSFRIPVSCLTALVGAENQAWLPPASATVLPQLAADIVLAKPQAAAQMRWQTRRS